MRLVISRRKLGWIMSAIGFVATFTLAWLIDGPSPRTVHAERANGLFYIEKLVPPFTGSQLYPLTSYNPNVVGFSCIAENGTPVCFLATVH